MSIEQFFSSVSERLSKENNLSDITWALCKTDPEFKNMFLRFCFKDGFLEEPFDLIREYSNDDSRPDLYFECSKGKYLLEVKIYDRNDHYDKYDKTFKNCTKAIIANYKMSCDSGYITSEWKEFYNNAVFKKYAEKNSLINGYRIYLKNVIEYVELHKMNLADLSSIYDFNIAIHEIVDSYDPKKCRAYDKYKSHSGAWTGLYFEYDITEKKSVYPWFGLIYQEPGIWISLDNQWKWNLDIQNKLKNIGAGKYHDKALYEEDTVYFKLKDKLFEKFNQQETTLEKQKKMLNDFFCEVMSYI